MRALRFNTAVILLLTGVLLMAAQFTLQADLPLMDTGIAGRVLTSDMNHGGGEHTGAAGCHEESAPRDQAPKNHDCCMVGHLHAMGSAPILIAPAFAVISVSSLLLQSPKVDETAAQVNRLSDMGPPGPAVPIRV